MVSIEHDTTDLEERELLLLIALKNHTTKALAFIAAARLGREESAGSVEEAIELENTILRGYELALKNRRFELRTGRRSVSL